MSSGQPDPICKRSFPVPVMSATYSPDQQCLIASIGIIRPVAGVAPRGRARQGGRPKPRGRDAAVVGRGDVGAVVGWGGVGAGGGRAGGRCTSAGSERARPKLSVMLF